MRPRAWALGGAMFLQLAASCSGLRFVEDSGVLEIRDGPHVVFGYRPGYVHPIAGLDGEVLTAVGPEDHPHHRGLSLMWPHVAIAGRTFDLWHQRGIRTVFVRWLDRSTRAGVARFAVEHAWQLDDGTRVCREVVRYAVHPATDEGRWIDVEYTLTALGDAITLRGQSTQKKGYGGLVLRLASRADRRRTVIASAGGPQKDGVHRRLPWADFSAAFHGREQTSGISVFPGEEHPDVPPEWMLRNYGLLNVAWPGLDGHTLEPDRPLTLRYRLWVHRGGARSAVDAHARRSGS